MRPPQPNFAPSGTDACHTDCWSLCEKSFGGSGTDLLLKLVRFVGTTSGPDVGDYRALSRVEERREWCQVRPAWRPACRWAAG